MPKRSPQEQALHQAQQPIYEALVLRKEIADLKRKLKELEGDLTTAYMAGYHKRDDEVRNLRARADALAGALCWFVQAEKGHGWRDLTPDSVECVAIRQADIALTAYRNREKENE